MKDKVNRLLLLVMVAFLVTGALAYTVAEVRIKEALGDQVLHRQEVVGRAGAKSMRSFLELLSHSLAILASNIDLESDFQPVLDAFANEWEGTPAWGVVFIDQEGIRSQVSFSRDVEVTDPQLDVADLEIFQEVRKSAEGEVIMGGPLVSRGVKSSELIIPVAISLRKDGQFRGALAVPVVVSDLTKEYLDPLKISEETRVYLMNSDGMVLYSPIDKLIGLNYFEVLKKRNFPGREGAERRLREILAKGEEGKVKIELPDEVTGGLTQFLIAYAPVRKHDGESCLLGIAVPVEETRQYFEPLRVNLIAGVVFVLLWVLAVTALMILMRRLAQKEAFEAGFAEGKKLSQEKEVKKHGSAGQG
jgi:hypothetical protein